MKYLFLTLALLAIPAAGFAAQGNTVQYAIDGQPYEGYFVSPAKDAPFILLIHDWDGMTEYEVKRAQMLADLGYAVFAADLFGAGVRPTETADKKRLTGALYKDRAAMRARMNAALDKATALGANTDNAVAMGYCFGGTAVLELARAGAPLKGFVPFHGGLDTPQDQDFKQVKGHILVFHGTTDKLVTMDQFAALAEELEAVGISHEMTTYSDAPHAFTVFGSPRYREAADKKSWARFTRFLEETLK